MLEVLDFIELAGFSQDWKALALNDEDLMPFKSGSWPILEDIR